MRPSQKLFKYANWFALAVFIIALAIGDYLLVGFAFLLGALTSQNWKRGVLTACVTSCDLQDITTGDECNIRGGLKTVYWAKYSDIDWADMLTDPLKFDPVHQEILDYTMVGAATFTKLTFERKQGKYDFTYTEDADVYEQIITMVFEGKSRDIRNAFAAVIGCCKIVLHIFDNNCLSRVVGVEYDGSTFEPQIKTLRIGRHLDSSGEFGSSKARDEMDIVGESLTPPLFSSIDEADMPI